MVLRGRQLRAAEDAGTPHVDLPRKRSVSRKQSCRRRGDRPDEGRVVLQTSIAFFVQL
jgi:hypothetical protein